MGLGLGGDFLVPGSYPSLFYIIYIKSPKRGSNLLIIKYLRCLFAKVYSIDFDCDGWNTWRAAPAGGPGRVRATSFKWQFGYTSSTGFSCLKNSNSRRNEMNQNLKQSVTLNLNGLHWLVLIYTLHSTREKEKPF